MKRSILKLEEVAGNGTSQSYRTIFKTQHGRVVFLSLAINKGVCEIIDCFYIDRTSRREGEMLYSHIPQKLKTKSFKTEDLLAVIAAELDKRFYGMEFCHGETAALTQEEYIHRWQATHCSKYRFLVMVGSGEPYNGLPIRLRTRLKSKLHRSIYIELDYYKDGIGVVKQCYYYDRRYKRDGVKVTPPTLISCFFPYTKEGIIDLLNGELCCDFTHMLVAEDIDIDANLTPLCVAV